jgi:hypothetical protein
VEASDRKSNAIGGALMDWSLLFFGALFSYYAYLIYSKIKCPACKRLRLRRIDPPVISDPPGPVHHYQCRACRAEFVWHWLQKRWISRSEWQKTNPYWPKSNSN